jgi:putative solute:sodium symporter small subunit
MLTHRGPFPALVFAVTTFMATFTAVKTVVLTLLGLWIAYSLAVQMFVRSLNRIVVPIVGLPLGTCLAVQGAVMVFLAALYLFSRKHRAAPAA